MIEITVNHTTDTAHRIPGHEGGQGKCARLHGHTYGYTVTLRGDAVDVNGFLVDFADVKRIIDEWDHRCLLWEDDPVLAFSDVHRIPGLVIVPYVPTAENMAVALADRLVELPGVTGVTVELRETPKTAATVTR